MLSENRNGLLPEVLILGFQVSQLGQQIAVLVVLLVVTILLVLPVKSCLLGAAPLVGILGRH